MIIKLGFDYETQLTTVTDLLIDFIGFLPVETRSSCLSEAASGTTSSLQGASFSPES